VTWQKSWERRNNNDLEGTMKLNPPKKTTFWVSIIGAAVGFVVYLLSHFNLIAVAWLGLAGVILVVAAFILLTLGLTVKGL
jgi:VIT1/CCC1 family predicted Fe2+/Mn2+ transporter